MSIGDLSTYPGVIDVLYNVYDESYTGYSITKEEITVPTSPYEATLKHWAKTGTITVPGYTEVVIAPSAGEFQVTDYYTPTESRTSIDYNIGKTLKFHSSASGNVIGNISYTTPGDKANAALINWMLDSIYCLETTLGTVGSGKQLDIGNYETVAQYLGRINEWLKTHKHAGGTGTESTRQLDADSFSSGIILNDHIASSAGITQTKLSYGIKEIGLGTIPAGTDFYVDITTSNFTAGNYIFISRGYYNRSDSGEVGELAYAGATSVTGGFRVAFKTDEAIIGTGGIPFTYKILASS